MIFKSHVLGQKLTNTLLLLVFHYQGMKSYKSRRTEDLVEQFREHDIILTTYSVLSSEIHYATLAPKRNMRMWKKYGAKKSPLVDICWWRVCLDEAQMVDGGFSNAAGSYSPMGESHQSVC